MTLWESLEARAIETPSKTAIFDPNIDLIYRDFASVARNLADFLYTQHGIRKGDRIAYLGFNSAAQICLIFAASRLGAMVSPLNWRLANDELSWMILQSDPKIIVADESHEETAAMIADARALVQADSCVHPPSSNTTISPIGTGDDPLLLVYTSGATGRPKGALLTQDAIMENADLSKDMHDMTSEDHILTALPMFHVGGLNIQTLPALLIGASVTLMERFEPATCLDLIMSQRPSLMVQVPATLEALMSQPSWNKEALKSIRCITTGSTDVPIRLIDAVHQTGIPLIQVYGATETGPVIIYQKVDSAKSHCGSLGRAGPDVNIRLIGSDGNDVAKGSPGEIVVKAKNIASGYWQNPDADKAFDDNWFHTGDIAHEDDDGFFWFYDRIKNLIISGGENIYPAELERVLRDVPGVKECAVVGRNDEKWGCVPVAVVALSSPIEPRKILQAFDGILASFKHPKDILVVDALPRNAMGKIRVDEVVKLVSQS